MNSKFTPRCKWSQTKYEVSLIIEEYGFSNLKVKIEEKKLILKGKKMIMIIVLVLIY